VPLHREQSQKNEKIRIYFEVYPHTNAGRAVSAILVNGGGPGFSTTAFRASWVTMFAPNLDAHDLLLQDDRGTGFSGAIDCKPLQFGLGPTLDDEVADCAAQLGDDDSAYGDGDSSQDVEALRSALGYDLVDYYGQSAGESDVIAYGTQFPQHLRSLTLDSPADNHWFTGHRYYARSAPVQEIRLDCLRSPTCAADHPNPDDQFAQLIRAVRQHPVRGHAYDPNGNLLPVNLDETGLLNLVFNAGQGQILDGGTVGGGRFATTR
jgi:pimeloyl-ACP methyl ester carboxylesterase